MAFNGTNDIKSSSLRNKSMAEETYVLKRFSETKPVQIHLWTVPLERIKFVQYTLQKH